MCWCVKLNKDEMDPILVAQGLQRLQKERDGWRDEAARLRAERDACRAALVQQRQALLYLNNAIKISRSKAKRCCREGKTDLKLAPIPETPEPSVTAKIAIPGMSITSNRGGSVARELFTNKAGSSVNFWRIPKR